MARHPRSTVRTLGGIDHSSPESWSMIVLSLTALAKALLDPHSLLDPGLETFPMMSGRLARLAPVSLRQPHGFPFAALWDCALARDDRHAIACREPDPIQ